MAEPKEPREPRIPKESPPFDADNKWTRTWIMYFESLFRLSVKEALRQTLEVAVTHSGDLTKDLPVFGDDAAVIKVGTKSGNTNKLVTNTGTNVTGNTVKWDASGNLIDAGTTPGGGGGGSGTVTSVALTVPAEFSVAGSPVTTSGTLAVSKATQSANTVYAGPTTGSAAAPTFRAVVPADLPLGSSSAFGAVKVDGTTITAASGVISMASPVIIAAGPTTQTDVTASRALGTVYHNTGSKPIFVEVYGFSTASNASLLLFTDSSNPPTTLIAQEANTVASVTRTVVGWVLPGNYYKVNWDAGTQTLTKWTETVDGSTSTPLTLVKGDLITYDTAATKLAVGTDGQVLVADSAQAKGIKWATAASSSGVIGTANFNGNGSISNAHYGGVISSVTFAATGKYTVNLSSSQSDFSVAITVSDDNTAAMSPYLSGSPDLHAGVSSFSFFTYAIGSGPRSAQSITVALLKL